MIHPQIRRSGSRSPAQSEPTAGSSSQTDRAPRTAELLKRFEFDLQSLGSGVRLSADKVTEEKLSYWALLVAPVL